MATLAPTESAAEETGDAPVAMDEDTPADVVVAGVDAGVVVLEAKSDACQRISIMGL